jgi:hypothetical protein
MKMARKIKRGAFQTFDIVIVWDQIRLQHFDTFGRKQIQIHVPTTTVSCWLWFFLKELSLNLEMKSEMEICQEVHKVVWFKMEMTNGDRTQMK